MSGIAVTRLASVVVLCAVLGQYLVSASHSHAQGEPIRITVRTTDAGFEPNVIEVEQGSLVEITFVWDHTAFTSEEHIIVFNDFKVESDQIDIDHREASVEFIASESGTFTFKCDLECELHDFMQNGQLVVLPSGGGGSGAPELTGTEIVVRPSGVSLQGDTVSIIATLLDAQGSPIPKAQLHYLLEENFIGTSSFVEVAVAETNETGNARVNYKPTKQDAANLVIQFGGAGIFDASQAAVEVPGSDAFNPVDAHESESVAALRSWAPGGLVIIVLSVWAILGFALYKAWAVSRIREEGGGPGTS